jgi:hypothetical protein
MTDTGTKPDVSATLSLLAAFEMAAREYASGNLSRDLLDEARDRLIAKIESLARAPHP